MLGKIVKSPLRYPGGKSKAVHIILDLLPQGLDVLVSPFTGGGSVELGAASKCRTKVYAYDAFQPLINFWDCAISDSKNLAEQVKKHHPISRADFKLMYKNLLQDGKPKDVSAVEYFVLNRASFGINPASYCSARFTLGSIQTLANFKIKNFIPGCLNFEDTIQKHPSEFLYCDPPYITEYVFYGQQQPRYNGKEFPHKILAELLKQRKGWLLSYNDCEQIRDLYKGHFMFSPTWHYSNIGKSQKTRSRLSNELLIFSLDYKPITQNQIQETFKFEEVYDSSASS